MQRLELKATHKPVQDYYAALRQFDHLGVTHESAVRTAFQGMLHHCAPQHDWTLVIHALASQSFSRADFLKKLDRFYLAMDQATATISDFSQEQQFLNTVYEKFFQGFCVEVADTHDTV